MVLLLILWFGLLVLCQRGDGWFMQFVTWPCCLGHLLFGLVVGLLVLLLILVLKMLLSVALHSWSSGQMGCLPWFFALACWWYGSWGWWYLVCWIAYSLRAMGRREVVLGKGSSSVYLRPGSPISVSAVPFGPGIDIWRSCRFIGALMRSLCLLPGGLGRFVPCSIGANHCRLRHIGWEKCGRGLTSRPRESALEPFLDELLQLFHHPPRSVRALLAGTLPFRYCAAPFASGAPTWRLPVSGHVASLVTADLEVAEGKGVEDASREVHWFSGSGPGRKRLRPNRKPPAQLAGFGVQSRPRVWKRLRHVGLSVGSSADYRRRRYEQRDDGYLPVQSRTDVG